MRVRFHFKDKKTEKMKNIGHLYLVEAILKLKTIIKIKNFSEELKESFFVFQEQIFYQLQELAKTIFQARGI